MSIVPLLVIIIMVLTIYSVVITYFYFNEESDQREGHIYGDLEDRLSNVRDRLNHIKRETPSYIELDISDRQD